MSPSTNPIGKGTCNFPLNMPIEESQIWGRLFGNSKKKSKAEFLRDALLEWAFEKHPQDAAKIHEARQRRAAMIGLLIFIVALIAPAIGITKKAIKDVRRARAIRVVPNRYLGKLDFVEV